MLSRHTLPRHLIALTVIAAVVGCSDNPTEPADHDDELSVELTLSSDHLHILSPVTFTATVRDHHDAVVTEFDSLRVERRATDGDTWRTAADLTLQGDAFVGTGTFRSSGEYHLRVVGLRTGHDETAAIPMHDTMQDMMGPVDVARAHAEAGGYRIEFESFPGHIHEGDETTFRFWVMEQEADADGNRAPITGLAGEIHCEEPNGESESHSPNEVEAGVYEATHTFVSAGEDGAAALHFTASDGTTEAEAEFELHIAHGH